MATDTSNNASDLDASNSDHPPLRLVCLDLDGTLVGERGHPTDEVWRAADEARAAGLHLSVCTARPATGDARDWAMRLDPAGWQLFQAGASLLHTGSLRFTGSTVPASAVSALTTTSADSGWVMEAYSHDDYVVDSDDTLAIAHAALLGVPYARRSLHDLRGDVVRVQLVVTDQQRSAALAAIPEGCDAAWATSPVMPGANFISVTATGVSKASGIRQLADLLGCTTEQVMMVGDGHNDVSAMRAVGLPVAMGNAPDDVAVHAQVVVAHVEADGAAEALRLAISLS